MRKCGMWEIRHVRTTRTKLLVVNAPKLLCWQRHIYNNLCTANLPNLHCRIFVSAKETHFVFEGKLTNDFCKACSLFNRAFSIFLAQHHKILLFWKIAHDLQIRFSLTLWATDPNLWICFLSQTPICEMLGFLGILPRFSGISSEISRILPRFLRIFPGFSGILSGFNKSKVLVVRLHPRLIRHCVK